MFALRQSGWFERWQSKCKYCVGNHFEVIFKQRGVSLMYMPPRYPSGIVLASSAEGPGFNSQSRTSSAWSFGVFIPATTANDL